MKGCKGSGNIAAESPRLIGLDPSHEVEVKKQWTPNATIRESLFW